MGAESGVPNAPGSHRRRAAPRRAGGPDSMAAKATKKNGWGGARPGAGRPRGSGQGPSSTARRNRVPVMLSDAELRQLARLARQRKKPLATVAWELITEGLARSD